MIGDRYYYLSALPTLGGLESVPPMRPGQLLEYLAPVEVAYRLVKALLLHDDLLQREGFAAGELTSVSPAVLSPRQVKSESALPAYLVGGSSHVFGANTTWEAYFRHVADVASTFRCSYLAQWVAFEVGLRNALVTARAERLGVEADRHLVAVDLGEALESFSGLLAERKGVANPLRELEMLIQVRWAWAVEHEAWYTYRDDEFVAYAGKLTLLIQYDRLVKVAQRSGATARSVEASVPREVAT